MARIVVTLTINPESPDVDLKKLEEAASKKVAEYGGDVGKVEQEELAFGLKALKIIFVMDESKGIPDDLEKNISELSGVASVRITDVRRTIG